MVVRGLAKTKIGLLNVFKGRLNPFFGTVISSSLVFSSTVVIVP